jgi:hypothetical protein
MLVSNLFIASFTLAMLFGEEELARLNILMSEKVNSL